MSLATLWRDVAECRAWEKRLHAGSKETRKEAALPGWKEWVLPPLMLLFGVSAWQWGFTTSTFVFLAVFPVFSLLLSGRLFPPSLPTEWEALALPSRRAWQIARWSHRWPALLWFGACVLGFLYTAALREAPRPHAIRWSLAVVYLLLPPFFGVIVSWFIVMNRLISVPIRIVPLVSLLLAALFAIGSFVSHMTRFSTNRSATLVTGALGGFAVLCLLVSIHAVRPRRHGTGWSRGWMYWASALGTLLLGTAGTLSLISLAVSAPPPDVLDTT